MQSASRGDGKEVERHYRYAARSTDRRGAVLHQRVHDQAIGAGAELDQHTTHRGVVALLFVREPLEEGLDFAGG